MADAQRVRVPVLLIDDDATGPQWYPETMDASAARRLAEAIQAGGSRTAMLTVELVLPPAADVRGAVDLVGDLRAEPVRIELGVRDASG